MWNDDDAMESLFILIPLSLLFIGLIAGVLIWAIRSGQYDDLERPRHEILLDDDEPVRNGEPPDASTDGKG